MSLVPILLRQERTTILGWGLGLFAYSFFIGSSYAFIADSAADYDKLWESMPEGLREAFGGDANIASVPGYYTSQLGSYLLGLLGLLLLSSTTKRLAGAEESGLLDHLLARPVTRSQHLAASVAAFVATAGLVLAGVLSGTLLGFLAGGASAGNLGRLVLAIVDAVPVALFFLGLGLLLGTAFHRRSPAFGLGLALALGLYALEIVAKVIDELSWLSYANPYGYYSRSDAFAGAPDPLYWTLLPLAGAAMTALAWRRFGSKDLKA